MLSCLRFLNDRGFLQDFHGVKVTREISTSFANEKNFSIGCQAKIYNFVSQQAPHIQITNGFAQELHETSLKFNQTSCCLPPVPNTLRSSKFSSPTFSSSCTVKFANEIKQKLFCTDQLCLLFMYRQSTKNAGDFSLPRIA